jgi:hypothetical protein
MKYLNEYHKKHHERAMEALKKQPKLTHKKALENSKKHPIESGKKPELKVLIEIREKIEARITELRSKKK